MMEVLKEKQERNRKWKEGRQGISKDVTNVGRNPVYMTEHVQDTFE